jgi:hypothetical protein
MPTISIQKAEELGIPKRKWMLHTILIPMAEFTKDAARNWLKEHNHKYGNHRMTENFHRFNQIPAIEGAKYRTKKIKNGIDLVYMRYS